MRPIMLRLAYATLLLASLAAPLAAQRRQSTRPPAPTVATQAGQDAFAAIGEIVRILEADPRTDWAQVNLETLRQHLIDMNDVVLRSTVRETKIPGGVQLDVTGTGRTMAAIRRMLTAHTQILDGRAEWDATAKPIPGGIRWTILSSEPGDLPQVARIRGLGFAGLLATGAHHTTHHLALARGMTPEEHAGH
jgi:hypothetical protein